MSSSKPEIKSFLDWVELCWWFKKRYPEQFKEQPVRDWLIGGRDGAHNGSLLTASGEVVDPEFDRDDYEATDWDAVIFFMETVYREWPTAVNDYGDVRLYFWW